jgi:hypothetical protein
MRLLRVSPLYHEPTRIVPLCPNCTSSVELAFAHLAPLLHPSYNLPHAYTRSIFTASAARPAYPAPYPQIEYTKGTAIHLLRQRGPRSWVWQVFSDPEETQIPQLQRFLHSNTLTRRYAAVRRAAEGLTAFCDSLEAYLSDEGDGEADSRAQSRVAYDRSARVLQAAVWGHIEALDQDLGLQVLAPCLPLACLLSPVPSCSASVRRCFK